MVLHLAPAGTQAEAHRLQPDERARPRAVLDAEGHAGRLLGPGRRPGGHGHRGPSGAEDRCQGAACGHLDVVGQVGHEVHPAAGRDAGHPRRDAGQLVLVERDVVARGGRHRQVVSEPGQAIEGQLDAIDAGRVGEADVAVGEVVPEVVARRHGHVGLVEQTGAPGRAVVGEGRDVGVDVERALGHDGDPDAEVAEAGDQDVATGPVLGDALGDDRPARRCQRPERGVLGRCRGRDVEVLGQRLDGRHRPRRADEPADPPARHAERLGEAVDHERVVGGGEHGGRRHVVDELAVDLVDEERAAEAVDGGGDGLELVGRDDGAGRVRRRGHEHARRVAVPGGRHRSAVSCHAVSASTATARAAEPSTRRKWRLHG